MDVVEFAEVTDLNLPWQFVEENEGRFMTLSEWRSQLHDWLAGENERSERR